MLLNDPEKKEYKIRPRKMPSEGKMEPDQKLYKSTQKL